MKVCIAAVLAIALTYAFAGDQPVAGGAGAVQQPPMIQKVTFDPDEIGGGRNGPPVEEITVLPKIRHPNLIKYRANWNEKVLKSVSAL